MTPRVSHLHKLAKEMVEAHRFADVAAAERAIREAKEKETEE